MPACWCWSKGEWADGLRHAGRARPARLAPPVLPPPAVAAPRFDKPLAPPTPAAFGASLAAEVRPYGIDVLVFHPSPVATRFYDKARRRGAGGTGAVLPPLPRGVAAVSRLLLLLRALPRRLLLAPPSLRAPLLLVLPLLCHRAGPTELPRGLWCLYHRLVM